MGRYQLSSHTSARCDQRKKSIIKHHHKVHQLLKTTSSVRCFTTPCTHLLPPLESSQPKKHPPQLSASRQDGLEAHLVLLHEVDDTAKFISGYQSQVSEEDNRRIRRRIGLHIMSLLMILYSVQFTDKMTLETSSTMGNPHRHLGDEDIRQLESIHRCFVRHTRYHIRHPSPDSAVVS